MSVNDDVDLTNADVVPAIECRADLEAIFAVHYARIARAIAFVTGDRSQAEELAVEVFLRWSRRRLASNVRPEAWLYRTAANLAIDELRKRRRRDSLNRFFPGFGRQRTPEEIHSTNQDRDRVRDILSRMQPRQAGLLVLRTEGLSYEELADAFGLKPGSVGTLLSRAQRIFRKEYIAKYGPQ